MTSITSKEYQIFYIICTIPVIPLCVVILIMPYCRCKFMYWCKTCHFTDVDIFNHKLCDVILQVPRSRITIEQPADIENFDNLTIIIIHIFIYTCHNCIEQYIPINNMIQSIIIHVMLNI